MAYTYALAVALATSQPAALPPVPVEMPVEAAAPAPVEETAQTLPAPVPVPAPATMPTPTEVADIAATEDDFLKEIKPPSDPFEFFNRPSFAVSQVIDKIILRPAAMVYRHAVPKPARDGARNALTNIGEPLVFVNDLLQLKPKRMLRTLGRFLVNSTIGLAGLFDIAKRKPFNLPHHDNSLADTLGYYGVGSGPYIYIPVFGPTTLRELTNNAQDLLLPKVVGTPFDRNDYGLATGLVSGLDQREQNDDDLRIMLSDAVDKYATFRSDYLQHRQGEIDDLKRLDGKEPDTSVLDDPLTDPAASVPPVVEPQPEPAPEDLPVP